MRIDTAVRIARAMRGLSQKQLAAAAGLTPSYVSLLEAGQRNPSPETIDRLISALQVPIHIFFLLASEERASMSGQPDLARQLGEQLLGLLVDVDSDPRAL